MLRGAWLALVCALCVSYLALASGNEQANALSKKFEKWFTDNGGVLKGVHVGSYEGMGRGLEAAEAIQADKLVLTAPASMIFSLSSMKSSSNPDIKTIYDAFPSEVGLTLWVLYERFSPASRFKEYMDILPDHVPSLLTFTATELQELQNEALAAEAISLQESIEAEYSSVLEHIRSQKSPSLPEVLSGISKEDYLHAATILNSRGLRFRGEVYLVPMADLFNYEPHKDKRAANSGEFFLKHHVLDKQTGAVSVYADRSQSKGLQLFEDYGDNTNEIYIKYHGFVPNRNPFHCVTVGGEKAIKQVTSKLPSRKPLLDGLHFKSIHPACVDERLVLGKHLEVYLTAYAMNTQETNVCMKAIHKWKKDWAKIFQQCGFGDAAQYLHDKLAGKEVQSFLPPPAETDGYGNDDEYEDVGGSVSSSRSNGDSSSSSSSASSSDATSASSHELTVLGERAWTLLQQVFLGNVKDQSALTTIHEDIESLAQVQFTLGQVYASATPEEYQALLHKEVALRYRLNNKRHYLHLCDKFQVSCEFLIRREASNGGNGIATAGRNKADASLPSAPGSDRSLELLLEDFNTWFNAHSPRPNQLKAVAMPIYRIGTVATEAIHKGDVYLGVPTTVILDAEKGLQSTSGIAPLLAELRRMYKMRDDFHELHFVLLYERFILREQSFYWPYLQLLPSSSELDIPIFWPEDQLRTRLGVSSLYDAALDYQQSVERKFGFIRNISLVSDFFGEVLTFENYRWATAILDSRTIWWNGKRHLVPMLDFINCQEGRDPAVVHSTGMDDEGTFATTRAGDDFEKGQHVFENYGQANHVYFLYHGFSLDSNTHDCVQVRFPVYAQEVRALEEQGLNKFLMHLGISAETDSYTTCLRWPLSPQLWAFLSFKTGTHMEALRDKKMGTPNPHTVSFLQRHLAGLVPQYAAFLPNVKHTATQRFLRSEHDLLQKLLTQLQQQHPDAGSREAGEGPRQEL